MRVLLPLFLVLFGLLTLQAPARAASLPQDKNGAVVLAYFQVSDDASSDSSVTIEQFRAHLMELQAAGANVVSLDDILAAWREDKALPPKTVAITFEGLRQSTVDNALPLLRQFKYPYTIFVAPGQLGRNDGRFADWNTLNDIAEDSFASFGLLPLNYQSYGTETQDNFWTEVNAAKALFRDKGINVMPRFLAYPYGVPPKAFDGELAGHNFIAGFGQQSGVAHVGSERWLLPRFTMTGSLGDEDRIRMLLQAAPLPATEVQPLSGALTSNPPAIGFTLPKDLAAKAKQLACNSSDGQKAKMTVLAGDHIELRFADAFTADRVRVNCTMAESADEDGNARSRWLGFLFEVKSEGEVDEGPEPDENPAAFDGQGLEP
jgi:peptidoglycan/xylan/chitin deacetylase (PgdA/CDA1 family)